MGLGDPPSHGSLPRLASWDPLFDWNPARSVGQGLGSYDIVFSMAATMMVARFQEQISQEIKVEGHGIFISWT